MAKWPIFIGLTLKISKNLMSKIFIASPPCVFVIKYVLLEDKFHWKSLTYTS